MTENTYGGARKRLEGKRWRICGKRRLRRSLANHHNPHREVVQSKIKAFLSQISRSGRFLLLELLHDKLESGYAIRFGLAGNTLGDFVPSFRRPFGVLRQRPLEDLLLILRPASIFRAQFIPTNAGCCVDDSTTPSV